MATTNPSPIRILLADDHPLLRDGDAGLVADQPDMKLVGEASNGREAIDQFRKHRPDIALLDLQMPEMNGIDAILAIRGEFPEARIVVLTTYTGDAQILRALKGGAQAYLLKSALRRGLPHPHPPPPYAPRRHPPPAPPPPSPPPPPPPL